MTLFAFALAFILSIFLVIVWLRFKKEKQSYEERIELFGQNSDFAESAHQREIQRLLDTLPGPYYSISQEGYLVRTNKTATELFRGRQIIGRSLQQVFLDGPLMEEIQKTLDSSTASSAILRFPPNSPFSSHLKDKDSHWEIELRPISISSEKLETQLIMRDVSHAVQTEQVRKDFVANASHELRTPLSIISGYLENLNEDEGIKDPEMSQYILQTMQRHVDRINRIVEDMLAISKLESTDGIPLNIQPFGLKSCVKDVIERLESVISAQDAEMINNLPDIEIEGDRFYWTQILFNLIENALKQNSSMPVCIRIEAHRIGEDCLQLIISDNGIGIPHEDLPFIFKRFYRVEKHHSQTQVKGTGLGLSIVKRAIEAHQGSITVQSIPGVETKFEITIPLSQPNA